MSCYLDTSILISMIMKDAGSARVDAWLDSSNEALHVSAWAMAEFAAVLWRRQRNREIADTAPAAAILELESWAANFAVRLGLSASAGDAASILAKRPDLKLSAPDALHLALAVQAGLTLVTSDLRLAKAARSQDHPVLVP